MSPLRISLLTLLAMIAFAANTVLARLALDGTSIDPASFTTVRLVSGALTLWLLVALRAGPVSGAAGNWPSALALFAYAITFSFAYVTLQTGVGALLLFGAVQATMILTGLWLGERLALGQGLGLLLALGGLVGLMLPGLSAPPLVGALLMLTAGVAWGIYSLLGRSGGDPLSATAANFRRAAPLAVLVSLALLSRAELDGLGIGYAVLSGALASGVGYAIWYTALPALTATRAATVQLSVPVIAAVGGMLLLAEPLSLRFILAAVAILGGIALVLLGRQ